MGNRSDFHARMIFVYSSMLSGSLVTVNQVSSLLRAYTEKTLVRRYFIHHGCKFVYQQR